MRSRTGHDVLAVALAAIVLAVCGSGCQNHEPEQAEKPAWEMQWAEENQWFASAEFAHAQAAAGAATDLTLNAHHFDGAGLNSLGDEKLALMLDGARANAGTVYLNLDARDSHAAARRASVEQWMTDHGMESGAIAIRDGANPANTTAAQPGLNRLWKTESPGPVAGSSGDDNSTVGNAGTGAGAPAGNGGGSN